MAPAWARVLYPEAFPEHRFFIVGDCHGFIFHQLPSATRAWQ